MNLFSNRRKLFALLIFVVTFALFSRVLQATFVQWDDEKLYTNPHLNGVNWGSLYWMFMDFEYVNRYLPLTWLGFEINYELGGFNPFGYHLGNLLLHSCNAVLLFLVLRRLFQSVIVLKDKSIDENDTFFLTCCALGAFVWSLHPLRTEPVAWASARLYSQCLFFLLISFLCYLNTLALPNEDKRRRRYYWGSVAAFAASLLSFQTGLGFFVVLLVLDFFTLRRSGLKQPIWADPQARRRVLEKIPFAVVVGVIVWLTLLARFNSRGIVRNAFTAQDFSFLHRVSQAAYVWAYYLWKPFVPFHLSPVYTTLISFKPFETRFVLSLALVGAVSIFVLWKYRRWPLLLGLWICYLSLLAPMIGITEHPHFSTDRYSYIVSLCLSVLIVAGLLKLRTASARRYGLFICGAAVLAFSALSFSQIGIWQTSPALFNHMIKVLGNDPYRATIYFRLGSFYFDSNKFTDAAKAYEEYLQIKPQDTEILQRLGETQFKLGRTDEAKAQFLKAIRLAPSDIVLRNAYGVSLAVNNEYPEAMEQFKAAEQIDPNYPNTFHNMALLLKKQGKLEEANVYAARAEALRAAMEKQKR